MNQEEAFDPDDRDWSEVVRSMREARAKSRGYADYWEWAIEPRRAEEQAAQVLRNFLTRSGEQASGPLSRVMRDPPDVLLTVADGRRLGIEVTELVNSEAVKRHRHHKEHGEAITYDWADWTPASMVEELSKLIVRKDRKLAKAAEAYDELLLAIITAEPLIDEQLAQEAVALWRPVVERIDRAFLLLSYQPGADEDRYPDGCPVLPIPLLRC